MKPFSLRSSDPYCLSAGLQEGQTKRTFKLSPRTKILTKESHFCDVQEQSSDIPPQDQRQLSAQPELLTGLAWTLVVLVRAGVCEPLSGRSYTNATTPPTERKLSSPRVQAVTLNTVYFVQLL